MLRRALAEDQLLLVYQPLVDLQSGAISSVEALLRWRHPAGALLEAAEALPSIEAAGMGAVVGEWVLQQACRDARRWRGHGAAGLKVAINISPEQFCDPAFGAAVRDCVRASDMQPALLSLEITEAALAHAGANCDALLANYRALGLNLILDDFGTGHSSLGNLRRYPFDVLKIDAQFVRNVVTDSGNAAMCRAIIAMAHHLGIDVVAEGVETEVQCDFLRRNMCDHIQGYFFAAPATPEQIDLLLTEQSALPPHLLRLHKPQRRLLLVDDEPNIVAALRRLLRSEHYQIFTAYSGQQGLDLLATQPVDVIVSDQRMPGMVGADFLRKAREQYPETIRIMLSGYTELQSVTDAVNEGAIYKFLTKPWDDQQLRGHIAEGFRVKEIADENRRLDLEVRTANQELAAANRRMEELLTEKQRQITRDEISLNIARELLQHLPLPVIGMDDAGMIAFVNGAAEALFRHHGALLGNEVASVLPQLCAAVDAAATDAGAAPAGDGGGQASHTHKAEIDGQHYAVVVYPMGERSDSRGSLISLSRAAAP
ncbi:EAL domain-containing protein [Pseudoduganella chitinolytica]|uniref:EAL domain-containing protein n=1 Tax=Pseudoduganella chitinolytica TaxID=34070 RepID=A0ABY8BG22_9BURK|nr:EAL domain-containing protein [Pseudoduganella chitinolytica]WEF34765.1 EAL domain-containing protein [Pseudoduganella chitinolytica]